MDVNFQSFLFVLSLYVSVETRHLGFQTPSLDLRRHTAPSRHITNLPQQNIGLTSSLWRQPIIEIPSRRRSFRQTFNRFSGFSRRFPRLVIRRQPYHSLRRRNPIINISRRQHPSLSTILTQRQILGGVRPISYDRFPAVRTSFPTERGMLSRSYPSRQQRLLSDQVSSSTIGRSLRQQRSWLQSRPSVARYSNIIINTQSEADDDSRSDGNIAVTTGHSDNTELLVNIRRTAQGTRVNINPPKTSDVLRNYYIFDNNPVSTSSDFGMSPSGYIVKDEQTKRQPAHTALHGTTHNIRPKNKPRTVPRYTSLQIVPNELVVQPILRESSIPDKAQKVKPYTRPVFPADSFFYSTTSDPTTTFLHSRQVAVQDIPDNDAETSMQASDHEENITKTDLSVPNATIETNVQPKVLHLAATVDIASKEDLVIPIDSKLESVVPVVPKENFPQHEAVSPVTHEKTATYPKQKSMTPNEPKVEPVPLIPVGKEIKINSVSPVVPLEKDLTVESMSPVVPGETNLNVESVPTVDLVEKDLTIEFKHSVRPVKNDLKIEPEPSVVPVKKDLMIETVPSVVPVKKDLKLESVHPVVPVKKDLKIEPVPSVVPVKNDLKIDPVPSVVTEKKNLKLESVHPVVPVKKDLKIEPVPSVVPVKKRS